MKPVVNLRKTSSGLICLNAGCGSHYWEDWVNLDFHKSRYVQYCDLLRGIPYTNDTFDVVYSSNIIEHFSFNTGSKFILELFRVCKPGGTIRLLTPDLERIVNQYLENLNTWSRDKSDLNRRRYEWILLEMFDQMTRQKSGGLMLEKILAGDVDPDYVLYRTGDELRSLLYPEKTDPPAVKGDQLKLASLLKFPFRKLRHVASRTRQTPFAESGELHKWYYDSASLEYLFGQAGFVNFKVVDYKDSRLSVWDTMNLDISASGNAPRKPDSIIVEASKPERPHE